MMIVQKYSAWCSSPLCTGFQKKLSPNQQESRGFTAKKVSSNLKEPQVGRVSTSFMGEKRNTAEKDPGLKELTNNLSTLKLT